MPSRIPIAKELADIFKVLSHPDRVRLIEELRAGERDVKTMRETLDLPATRVSQHLALLRAYRMVEERREGRHVYYQLTQPDLADWVVEGLRFLEARLNGDSKHLELLDQVRELWSADEQT